MQRKTKRGARKLSMEALKEALDSGKSWVGLGVVTKAPNEATHYEVQGFDVMVDVELVDTSQLLLCKLQNSGSGVLYVPDVGDEVVVAFPGGSIEYPVIVATLGNRDIPTDIVPGTIVIMAKPGKNVLVCDGNSADSVPLALKSDVQAIKDAISNSVIGTSDGGASMKTTILNALVQYPVGTSTLKAK